ncbi:hypothetical protein [uncultured Dokdonia sp.]|uniref:hypothetical protein n=1 Tax=uncultured Dokdonia sp. TaxID=575653 RepID=UPI00260EA08F|nr:hypothetical protein [uncultured Dokdonia sp.]
MHTLLKTTIKALVLVLFTIQLQAQSTTFQLVETETGLPIPFAAIEYGENTGTITNEEGYFSIPKEQMALKNTIHISSLGYDPITLNYDEYAFAKAPIALSPSVNTLNTVYLNNKRISVDTIMNRMFRNRGKNYTYTSKKQRVFSRKSGKSTSKGLEIKYKKDTNLSRKELDRINKKLAETDLSVNANYSEVLADYYTNDISQTKLDIIKATELSDGKNKGDVSDKAMATIRNILEDSTKTYKVKTGWIKVEDSLSFRDMVGKQDSLADKIETKFSKKDIDYLVHSNNFFSQFSNFDFITTQNRYKYILEEVWDTEDDRIYKIRFEPKKRKGKYAGTILINDSDYAVLKINYTYADGKRGRNLNFKWLLGFKYTETGYQGTLTTRKTNDGTYVTSYIKEEQEREIYVNRPLKLVENKTKHKMKFNVKTTQVLLQKTELFFISDTPLTDTDYTTISEKQYVPIEKLTEYNDTTWKNYEILEPLNEMKHYN